MLLIRVRNCRTAARSSSWGILSHSLFNALSSESKLISGLEQALLSKLAHTSSGFRSGLDGGHSVLDKKSIFCSLSQDCVAFEACAGAESCWNIQSSFLNRRGPAFLISVSRIKFLYVSEFIFTPFGIKMRFVLESAVTPTQTMIERGF